MCGCDELEHSLKCGGCAKLQASEKNVVPIIDLQEYNGDGFPIPRLLKGRDNVERNFVLFDSSRPFFTKLKDKFREIIIQRGDGSMATIVKKLFEEGVFPPNETFEEVFEKVLEDYMHGLLWGVLIKIYESNNKTQYPIAPSLMYKVNYCAGFNEDFVVFDKGFFDAKINESQLKSNRLKGSGDPRYCTKCNVNDNSVVTDCNDCP
jgi:hypothetical protein